MKKIVIASLVPLTLCAALSAQNINQSVQVTNDYVTRFADFQKQGGALQVPDSLYRFDYDFDYSVFETPYRGSYEFTPYRIRVTPDPRPLDAASLYLRAGAGVAFRPQLLLAWQPVQKRNGAVGVTAGLDGFAGRYRTPAALTGPEDAAYPASVPGHDLSGRFGIEGHYLAPAVRLSGRAGYEGLFAGRDRIGEGAEAFRSAFNVLSLQGRAQSREREDTRLFYDIDARFRYGSDAYPDAQKAGEGDLAVALSAGPVLPRKYRILLDALFELDNVSGFCSQAGSGYIGTRSALLASVKPHADFLLGGLRVDAGVRLDYSSSGAASADPATLFSLAPDVSVRLPLLGVNLELFAGVSGGQSIQGLYEAKQVNRFSYRSDAAATVARERLRVRGGLEGHWGSRLQYGLEAGYVSYAGALLPALLETVRADWRSAYARARLSWKDERFEMDGRLDYVYSRFSRNFAAYAPPAFTADLQGVYNWQRKVFAGAFLRIVSARDWLADGDPIPGYADFGLTGELRISRCLGAWLEAGNLFEMAIERAPGFIEKSPYITVGVSLKL